MSRWTERFRDHQFQKFWRRLKDSLQDARVNDETVVTDVAELGRLKRVVSYIDGLIKSLDPELVPFAVWDNFASQADFCGQQIEAFNATRAIVHIQNANEHADNLLTYVRPYMVVTGRQAKNLRDSAAEYIKALDEYVRAFSVRAEENLSAISVLRGRAVGAAEELTAKVDSVDAAVTELLGSATSRTPGLAEKFKDSYEDFASKYNEIVSFYNETFSPEDDSDSTKDEIAQVVAEVKRNAESAREALLSNKSLTDELSIFYAKVFGAIAEDGKRVGGLDEELKRQKKNLEDFEGEQKGRYSALNEQIESLLPGAASAGLASAYSQMRATFDKPLKNASRLFYAAIAAIVVVSFISMTQKIWFFGVEFAPIGDLSSVFRGFLYKLPIIGPLIWLAYYASRRRSECQRLQQEYAHKEALAKSYDSYKKQVVDLGGDRAEMLESLITKAIEAIAYNASATLDGRHGDNPPFQAVVDKLLDKVPDAQN